MKTIGIIVGLICVVHGSKLPDVKFNRHFENLQTTRHPLYHGGSDWLEARSYINSTLLQYGIVNMTMQSFNTSITSISGKVQYAIGMNLIGIIKGIKKDAPVIVIGADYDTPITADPYKNNAGGIAVLLETVKLFEDRLRWNPYNLDKTVIFVAFDLNTKEYSTSSAGKSGSYHFVHEWLPKFLEEHDATLNGAIILDSVTTYYDLNNTQMLKNGFESAFPEAYTRIINDGSKGDFLGLASLGNEAENDVKNSFMKNYNKDRKKRRYRLQDLPLQVSLEVLTDEVTELVNHQAQYHFWTFKEQDFPAFLLFDTDDSRYLASDDQCLGGSCDAATFLTNERVDFMTHTVHTLLKTLMELQTSEYAITTNSNSKAADGSFMMVIMTFFAAMMFHQ